MEGWADLEKKVKEIDEKVVAMAETIKKMNVQIVEVSSPFDIKYSDRRELARKFVQHTGEVRRLHKVMNEHNDGSDIVDRCRIRIKTYRLMMDRLQGAWEMSIPMASRNSHSDG